MGVSALGIVLAFIAGSLVAVAIWLDHGRNSDVESEVEILNPGGESGTALVVYHLGRSDFQRRVFSGFAQGLVSHGWRVEMTTPSPEAPAEFFSYDLLVVGGPTYWFTPNRPIKRYLHRLGDLAGKPTVTCITGLGAAEGSSAKMQELVRARNGNIVRALLLYKMRPNDDDNYVNTEQNKTLAVEMATQAAKEVGAPALHNSRHRDCPRPQHMVE
jgi:hypothetical protein